MEYLVDLKANPPQPIVQVHIAELLAGIPWTEARVKQHIVNEVAQALYKAFVFTSPSANPLQRWKQGTWLASWSGEPEGDQTCTLYASIKTQEYKLKPRRGRSYGWNRLPDGFRDKIQAHMTDNIATIEGEPLHWDKMKTQSPTTASKEVDTTHPSRFSVLGETGSHNTY
jgi:hypothetical protein